MSVVHSLAPEGVTFANLMETKLGGSYVATVVLTQGNATIQESYQVGFHEITSPNSVHMLWYALNQLFFNLL